MIKPLLDNVVVKAKAPTENTSASGIILTGEKESEYLREVVAIGRLVPPDEIKVGDVVRVVSQTYKEKFKDYEIIKYEHILAVVNN